MPYFTLKLYFVSDSFVNDCIYIFDVIPTVKRTYITRNDDKPPHFKVKHNCSKNPLFPSTVIEWKKLDLNIRNFESLKGIQLIIRLKLGLSHLSDTNLSITFRTPLIQFVTAVKILSIVSLSSSLITL